MGAETTGSPVTVPASDEARRFEGWHANLKPAWEPCLLARKPLDKTLADNALKHGVAGLNVDGCRIGGAPHGRWPSNFIMTCDESICGPGDPRAIEHHPNCHVAEMGTASRFYAIPKVSKRERAGIPHPCCRSVSRVSRERW